MYRNRIRAALIVANIFAAGLLAGCGGGGSSSGGSPVVPATVALSGSVSAPNAAISFNRPTALDRMLAGLFGKAAYAVVPGSTPVGAGVTVNLIEIDSAGNQVGAVIATGVTDASGGYTLQAPAGFTPASKYVVRAVGSTASMDAFVTSAQIDIDPYTNTSRVLITGALTASGASLASVNLQSIDAVQQTVVDFAKDVTPLTDTASQLSVALQAEVQNSEESNNIVTSVASPGIITGKVTDSSNAALANVLIVVKKFGDQVVQAHTLTDASGDYTVHVPNGDYVIGALNRTTTSFGASEWYTAGGGTTVSFSAEKVAITNATPLTRDFVLAPGGRVSGTVTAQTGGAAVAGINVAIRDYSSDEFIANARTRTDGTYAFSLPAGVYRVSVSNRTLQALVPSSSIKVTVVAGTTVAGDFSLGAGKQISGTVLDAVNGAAVAGMAVRFYDSTDAFVEGFRTNSNGGYRLWLPPAVYTVRSRGQSAVVDISTNSQTQVFNAPAGQITATIQDSANNPVSGAKLRMYDSTGANLLSFEVSGGDGTVTLFSTAAAANNLLELKIDNGVAIGSSIYLNGTRFLSGTAVAAPAPGATLALGTVNLPAGVVLSGTVTKGGTPAGNAVVQVRSGAKTGNDRFVSTRTQSDGTYTISVPAGTYNRICAFDAGTTCPGTTAVGTTYKFVDSVVMTAGVPKTLDFAY
jgi:hypothetical protein